MVCKTRGRDAVAGSVRASGRNAAFCICIAVITLPSVQNAELLIVAFSLISCVNGRLLRQLRTAELVWLAAEGIGAPPLRKRAKSSRVG